VGLACEIFYRFIFIMDFSDLKYLVYEHGFNL